MATAEARARARPRLSAVQVLRVFAAALVVMDHALQRSASWWSATPDRVDAFGSHIGVMGVYAFFVISGFIMAHTSLRSFGSSASASEFMIRRVLRIVPMYWLATLLETCLRLLRGSPPSALSVIHSLLFIPEPPAPGGGRWMRPVLGNGWTLNYEMFFYVLFALAMLLPVRRGMLALLVGMPLFVGIGAFVKPFADTAEPVTRFTYWSDPIVLLFVGGCLLGVLNNSKLAAGIPRVNIWIALLSSALAIAFCAAGAGAFPPLFFWRAVSFLIAFTATSLCVFAASEGKPSWLVKRLEFLGDASYSTYLFHFLVTVAIQRAWTAAIGPSQTALFVLTVLIASNAVGLLCHQYLEKPITSLLHPRILRRSTAPGGALASELSASALPDGATTERRLVAD